MLIVAVFSLKILKSLAKVRLVEMERLINSKQIEMNPCVTGLARWEPLEIISGQFLSLDGYLDSSFHWTDIRTVPFIGRIFGQFLSLDGQMLTYPRVNLLSR